jgi:hypothetical protein
VGGIAAHAAGGRLDPGLNLVGERGPELVDARSGRVFTAGQTATMRGGAAAGGSSEPAMDYGQMAAAFASALSGAPLRIERRGAEVLARIVRAGEQSLRGTE